MRPTGGGRLSSLPSFRNQVAAAVVARGMTDLNPGSRPRRGLLAVSAAAAAAALVTGLVVAGGSTPAAAADLDRFGSCAEVAEWGRASARAQQAGGMPVAIEDRAAVQESTATAAGGRAGGEGDASAGSGAPVAADGGTNVVVEGVDELDVVERLGGDRALVTAGERLAVVDLAAARIVAEHPVPAGAQVTYDEASAIAWVVGPGHDGGGVTVARVAVGEASLEAGGEWTTSGRLVDARRIGDRLHLVAAEDFVGEGADGAVPFAEGPVPCDQVLHPVGPSAPSATLLVTLPAEGPLEPEHAAEVVGAGQFVHVTDDAAYLATPRWDGAGPEVGVHRFDLDGLEPTGSGRVAGALIDEFSMSEHDGHLRVAVIAEGGMGGRPMPMPMPVEGDGGIGDGADDVAPAPEPAPGPEPAPDPGPGLNEVVVLDTDGDLDVVGRTARFGHLGETLRGVRFVGDVAYAVTFLEMDPFYVLDLADPAAPAVAGEVELPGFSSYLHPISDTLVAGFGPGDRGRASVKLFDVSDPAAPKVVDDLVLGDESAVTDDHHAFVDLGDGRFAVPAMTWPTAVSPGTSNDVVVVDASSGQLVEEARHTVTAEAPATRVLPSDAGWAILAGTQLVLLDPAGAERATLDLA